MKEIIKDVLLAITIFVCVISIGLNKLLFDIINDKNDVIISCWESESGVRDER